MNVSKQTKLMLVQAPLTAGSTTNNLASNPVDMTGFDGCRFISTIGATSTAVTLIAQMASTTTSSDFAAFGTSITTAATTVADRILALDVYKPTKRYLRTTLNSTGGNDSGGTIAELYGARVSPTTNASTDVVSEAFGVST